MPLQIYENFEGGLVDTLKRQDSHIYLQPVWTMSNLSKFTKDKSKTSWWPGTRQRLRLYWSSEADSKPKLSL